MSSIITEIETELYEILKKYPASIIYKVVLRQDYFLEILSIPELGFNQDGWINLARVKSFQYNFLGRNMTMTVDHETVSPFRIAFHQPETPEEIREAYGYHETETT